MYLFYAPDDLSDNKSITLPEEESQHALRVLRLNDGDEIMLTDGKGYFYKAVISAHTNKKCIASIVSSECWKRPWQGYIHLAVAPTKNMDRNEWLAEKATEIGLDELSFLNCRYSERKVIKTDRVSKILISAMKQSQKALLPKLNDMISFSEFIKQPFDGQKFIAHCYPGEKPLLRDVVKSGVNATLMIGPEGDFSEEEVVEAMAHGWQPISLGNTRLRTETAALVGMHIINLTNQ
jgi:16S rRNA (uracil1498-N3)-methyltransferase